MTTNLTHTTSVDQARPVAPLPNRRRRGAIAVAAAFAVVLTGSAVAWSAQSTDRSPGAPSGRPGRQEAPSLLESPAAFDRAVADAVGTSELDSIMHDGDAFDRAVEAAK